MKPAKRLYALLLAAALLLLPSLAAGGSQAIGFRAVWVATVYNLDYPAKGTTDAQALRAQADAILQNSADMGMNAVILQVRPSCDAFYPSTLFPWSRYLTGDQNAAPQGGFDPLAYWVERAHALGLELHAWVNPFRVTKGGQTEFDALSPSSPAKLHPDWVVEFDKNFYLNPGLPQVRELVIQGAEELVRNYDLDGVHLDDYFYPGSGFNDAAAYAQYGSAFSSLADWRRDNINQLIRDLDARLHALDPSLRFGVSPAGVWADAANLSGGSNTSGGYETYFQAYADTRRWVREGWVDYICPQLYWPIGHAKTDYKALAQWWAGTVRGTGVDLYIGMADYMAGNKNPDNAWYGTTAIENQLALNDTIPEITGEVHFRYQFLADSPALRAIYQARYGQAAAPAPTPIPTAAPTPTPVPSRPAQPPEAQAPATILPRPVVGPLLLP